MPVQSLLVRFQKSGGNANTDPDLSLGGQIAVGANANFVTNTLHNVFDEVSNTEAVSGEYEYRHVYYRNSHTFEVKNVRLLVVSDTTSIWSKLEFARGTAAVGNVEQAIPNENTSPAGIPDANWKIPSLTAPIILADKVAGGGTASFWIRRKIEPGALIARNERVHIRIIVDPTIAVAPPITCPDGQHYDSTTQTCVDDEDPDDPGSGVPCPEGQILVNGQCVPIGSPPPPTQVTMAVAGDFSCNSTAEEILGHIAHINTASKTAGKGFIFVANGDLSYTSSRDCFVELIEDLGLKDVTKISIGNHDDEEEQSTTLRNSYVSYFGIPSQGYYSFNIQNIHVLIMDTQSNYASNSAQFTFARNDLQTASQTANIDWIIVCYHKPSMTAPTDHDPLTDFRDTYHPLFDQFKVDVVVASHNHNLQRSYPVKYNAASPANPTIVSTHASHVYAENMDARIFVVSGGGGRTLDDLDSTAQWNFVESDHGFLLMEWSNNNKRLIGKMYVSNGPDNIEELDMFELNKLT